LSEKTTSPNGLGNHLSLSLSLSLSGIFIVIPVAPGIGSVVGLLIVVVLIVQVVIGNGVVCRYI
jgi:hypothetical protein